MQTPQYEPGLLSEVTMSVFFCGTDGRISNGITQISLFSRITDAVDISDPSQEIPYGDGPLKMAFDGCGVTNGLMGTVFAYGLKEQCQQVVSRVQALFSANKRVRLNCVGLSRGGMAIMMLAKMLADYDKKILEMNILLFDPVPGNLITSSQWDIFSCTLANSCMDMSMCVPLNRVLSIYPYMPLPDIAFHAPIIPKYPSWCQVEEDVTLGCHQAALVNPSYNLSCLLSFLRIRTFLLECGTTFTSEITTFSHLTEESALYHMQNELQTSISSVRHTHSWRSSRIVRYKSGKFLNRHHEHLLMKFGQDVEEKVDVHHDYMLDIEVESSHFSFCSL